jgi:hypothetical protein
MKWVLCKLCLLSRSFHVNEILFQLHKIYFFIESILSRRQFSDWRQYTDQMSEHKHWQHIVTITEKWNRYRSFYVLSVSNVEKLLIFLLLTSRGSLLLTSCGSLVLTSCGSLVLTSCGTLLLTSCGTLSLTSCGTLLLASCGTLSLTSCGTLSLASRGSLLLITYPLALVQWWRVRFVIGKPLVGFLFMLWPG